MSWPGAVLKLVQKDRRAPAAIRAVQARQGGQGRYVQAQPGFEVPGQPGGFSGPAQQRAFHGHICLSGQPAMGRILTAQSIHQTQLLSLLPGEDLAAG